MESDISTNLFQYAATGFLVEYEENIYAATAKHVLWVAKPERHG